MIYSERTIILCDIFLAVPLSLPIIASFVRPLNRRHFFCSLIQMAWSLFRCYNTNHHCLNVNAAHVRKTEIESLEQSFFSYANWVAFFHKCTQSGISPSFAVQFDTALERDNSPNWKFWERPRGRKLSKGREFMKQRTYFAKRKNKHEEAKWRDRTAKSQRGVRTNHFRVQWYSS